MDIAGERERTWRREEGEIGEDGGGFVERGVEREEVTPPEPSVRHGVGRHR